VYRLTRHVAPWTYYPSSHLSDLNFWDRNLLS
jgi:hypothetical protein